MPANAVIAFVYDTRIVEINSMIVFPRIVGNMRAIRIVLQVPLMFLFAGLEASSGFSYVVPRTVYMEFCKQHCIEDPMVV